jgi:hypothetical protein
LQQRWNLGKKREVPPSLYRDTDGFSERLSREKTDGDAEFNEMQDFEKQVERFLNWFRLRFSRAGKPPACKVAVASRPR